MDASRATPLLLGGACLADDGESPLSIPPSPTASRVLAGDAQATSSSSNDLGQPNSQPAPSPTRSPSFQTPPGVIGVTVIPCYTTLPRKPARPKKRRSMTGRVRVTRPRAADRRRPATAATTSSDRRLLDALSTSSCPPAKAPPLAPPLRLKSGGSGTGTPPVSKQVTARTAPKARPKAPKAQGRRPRPRTSSRPVDIAEARLFSLVDALQPVPMVSSRRRASAPFRNFPVDRWEGGLGGKKAALSAAQRLVRNARTRRWWQSGTGKKQPRPPRSQEAPTPPLGSREQVWSAIRRTLSDCSEIQESPDESASTQPSTAARRRSMPVPSGQFQRRRRPATTSGSNRTGKRSKRSTLCGPKYLPPRFVRSRPPVAKGDISLGRAQAAALAVAGGSNVVGSVIAAPSAFLSRRNVALVSLQHRIKTQLARLRRSETSLGPEYVTCEFLRLLRESVSSIVECDPAYADVLPPLVQCLDTLVPFSANYNLVARLASAQMKLQKEAARGESLESACKQLLDNNNLLSERLDEATKKVEFFKMKWQTSDVGFSRTRRLVGSLWQMEKDAGLHVDALQHASNAIMKEKEAFFQPETFSEADQVKALNMETLFRLESELHLLNTKRDALMSDLRRHKRATMRMRYVEDDDDSPGGQGPDLPVSAAAGGFPKELRAANRAARLQLRLAKSVSSLRQGRSDREAEARSRYARGSVGWSGVKAQIAKVASEAEKGEGQRNRVLDDAEGDPVRDRMEPVADDRELPLHLRRLKTN